MTALGVRSFERLVAASGLAVLFGVELMLHAPQEALPAYAIVPLVEGVH